MKEINSTKNAQIKEIKKLHKRKYREKMGKYLLEGFHLVEEAVLNNAQVILLIIDERGYLQWGDWLLNQPIESWLVSEEVMKDLSELPTPQGILAIVKKEERAPINYRGKWLLLDNIQDPGNVGTMIRTADAAGFDGVLLGKGTADVYMTKVLRSMQGSQYHLSIYSGELEEEIKHFKKEGIPIYGTALNKEAPVYNQVEKSSEVALILGNEGAGVSKDLLEHTDANLYIPIYGKAESLNVAVAAALVMYVFT